VLLTAIRRLTTDRVDPRPLGVTRAGVGLAALIMTVELGGYLSALASPNALRLPQVQAIATPVLAAWPLVLALWALAAVAFAIGLWTSLAGTALVVLAVAFFLADSQLYSNHLYLLTLVVAVLTLAGAGPGFSVDAHGRDLDGLEPVPAWGPFLVKFQVTVLYAFSALAKLNGSYLSGSVMASYLRADGPLAIPEGWRSFQAMFVLSIVAVAVEGLLAVGLWIPKWRRNAFVAGLFLHLGILLTFQPTLPFVAFGVLSLSLYVPFLDAAPASRLVIWDASCGFCSGWVRWWRRLDWLGALSFAPMDQPGVLEAHGISEQAAAEALHVLGPNEIRRGFGAVRAVAEVLPVSFLWAPLLSLPPIQWLGERAYRAVARRRSCAVAPGRHPAENQAPA
jgi:predicted DCC family thiol-disulfide oxidoreductase YuxK